MTTIKIGNDAGNYDVDVLDMTLNALTTMEYTDISLESHKGVSTLTVMQGNNNYMQLSGTFNLPTSKHADIGDVVRSVTSLTVVEGGDVSYTISDLKMSNKDVASDSAFAKFLNAQTYKIMGNAGDNLLAAGNGADQLYGNSGNDELYGSDGNDRLFGGTGKDLLSGGNQDDQLSGDDGDDKLDGGDGKDRLLGGTGKDLLTGGDQDDQLSGDDGDDKLNGGDGNDKLTGGLGSDVLKGGDGNDLYMVDKLDTIVETKKGGSDIIVSEASVDLRKFAFVENLELTGTKTANGIGSSENNTITGNDAANTLWGGKGLDILEGGKGADVFQFVKGDGKDQILDFDASGKGQDHIDLGDFGGHLKFSSLDIEKLGKHDVSIDFGRGDVLVLHDVSIKEIDARDFQF